MAYSSAPVNLAPVRWRNSRGEDWLAAFSATETNEYNALSPVSGHNEPHVAVTYTARPVDLAGLEGGSFAMTFAVAWNRNSPQEAIDSALEAFARCSVAQVCGDVRGEFRDVVVLWPFTAALITQIEDGPNTGLRARGALGILRPICQGETVAGLTAWIEPWLVGVGGGES
jgi:hypothetical protein